MIRRSGGRPWLGGPNVVMLSAVGDLPGPSVVAVHSPGGPSMAAALGPGGPIVSVTGNTIVKIAVKL